ncbi:uncharacterized protein LOC110426591 [Herrania umbratica]|uniref:Uncharacterized protein LOC110426591 n=1 Tax=Herrania umbratica TaxID=108875 RepID=A0A6J1BD92_9ROSI|nr:uncharacterized protein LOC110426591 [Herrania umbratica]
MGQLANAINNRPQGTLLSNTEPNPKREGKKPIMTVTFRSGKEVKDAQATHAPPPFPQHFQKKKLDAQFQKFLEVFKKLYINILFTEALEQMPSYVKFLKDFLTNKRRLDEYEIVEFTKECSAIIQNKLSPNLNDPRSFFVPCATSSSKFSKALCDLSASVSLMPFSVARKLGLKDIQPTIVTLQLSYRTIRHPIVIIEDVLVKIGHLYILVDFLVLEMEKDVEIPLILRCPFLAIASVTIDVKEGKITFRVRKETTRKLKGKVTTFVFITSVSSDRIMVKIALEAEGVLQTAQQQTKGLALRRRPPFNMQQLGTKSLVPNHQTLGA